jgi:predicted peptidase
MLIPVLPPGIHELTLEPHGHRVTLRVPEGYDPSDPVPLVMVLHWGGPVPPFTGRAVLEGLAEPALAGLGALLVAPDRNREDWANPESEAEVLDLLDAVEAAYAVDRSRTLLTGYSLGGIGTWYVAGRNPGRFRAALPVSAAVPGEAMRADWTAPLYVIHGRRDEIFPAERTEEAVLRLRERGAELVWVLVEGVTHFDTGGFVDALRDAVGWIRTVWERV